MFARERAVCADRVRARVAGDLTIRADEALAVGASAQVAENADRLLAILAVERAVRADAMVADA